MMDQPINPHDQGNIFGPVIAPPTIAFDRAQAGKLCFPIAQNMRLEVQRCGNFPNSAECVWGFSISKHELASDPLFQNLARAEG